MTAPVRVAIADDHPIVREGLRRAIDEQPDLETVAEVDDGYDLLRVCRETEIDVVLLDISMPGPGFTEVLTRLRAGGETPRVLVLSMHPARLYGVQALKAGAHGYLGKGQPPSLVVQAIRRVAQGGKYVPPELAERLAELIGDDTPAHENLSTREYQVLRKIGAGRTLAEIAAELSLSPKTVSTYRLRILGKLGLQRTAELVRYAVEHEIAEES